MKCPHCLVEFHAERRVIFLGHDVEGDWAIEQYICPNPHCNKFILYLVRGVVLEAARSVSDMLASVEEKRLVNPIGSSRPPAPPQVPQMFAEDYREACVVLPYSPNASAALSRRCLQNLLREAAKVDPRNLANEIQQVLDNGKLPSHIAEAVDAIRNIGNFAAHPIKSEKTGEILPVEPGEAEWNLDVLEALFDFYFVQPEVLRKKREALDAKLKGAGKPPMK